MLLWRLRNLAALTLVLALLIGCTALAYAWWCRPLLAADSALAAGDIDGALAAYARAESRFRRLTVTQYLLADDYARAIHNQLALLHETAQYEAVIAKGENAPLDASPRFWTGCALFSLAAAESKPEVRLVWLSRAESEFKQALEASPDDWDAKYNYEVTSRLVEQLRKQPADEPDTLMQLLRPQQRGPRAVRKRG
jgi:hypothetical protein